MPGCGTVGRARPQPLTHPTFSLGLTWVDTLAYMSSLIQTSCKHLPLSLTPRPKGVHTDVIICLQRMRLRKRFAQFLKVVSGLFGQLILGCRYPENDLERDVWVPEGFVALAPLTLHPVERDIARERPGKVLGHGKHPSYPGLRVKLFLSISS